MSGYKSQAPVLTPPTVIAGREQVHIVEFARVIPQGSLLTFNFYQNGEKLGTIPLEPLGLNTAKAKFPGLKMGDVEVVVHINREESPLEFPHFRIHVQSQFEAMFGSALQESNQIPLLASVIAYLSHFDENDREICLQADSLLCYLLQHISTLELSDWSIASLLTGKHSTQENLLHFCARRHLVGTAEHLMVSIPKHKKQELLSQRSSDNKTPLELAQRNDMKRVVELAQMMINSPGDKKTKGKKKKVEKSRSIDSQINHLGSPGSPDTNVGSTTPLNQSPDHRKKESKAANILRRFGRKDKGGPLAVSNPRQLFVNEFGEPMIAPLTPGLSNTLPISRSMEPIDKCTATWSEHAPHETNFHRACSYAAGTTSPPLSNSPLLQSRHKLTIRSPITFPRNAWPGVSCSDSVGSSLSSFDQAESGLLHTRSVSSSLSGTSDHGSTLSSAIRELKHRALYIAEVLQDYNWIGVAQGDSDCILQAGQKVFVTQEGVEGDNSMCLGVWNGRYGKLPRGILKQLPYAELQRQREQEMSSDDDDYEKLDEASWLEGGSIYKIPRNVPAQTYLPGSESDEDQPVYDVPPNRPHIESTHPNLAATPSGKLEAEAAHDPVYDVPPSRPLSTNTSPNRKLSSIDVVYRRNLSTEVQYRRKLTTEGPSSRPLSTDYSHVYFDLSIKRPKSKAKGAKTLGSETSANDTVEPNSDTEPAFVGQHDSEKPTSSQTSNKNQSVIEGSSPQWVSKDTNDASIVTKTAAKEMNTATDQDQNDNSCIYDCLESALSETMLLMQSVADDIEDQSIYDDIINPPANSIQPHQTKTTKEDQAPRNSQDSVNASSYYSSLIPREKATKPSNNIGYDEIKAIKNIMKGDCNEIRVGRMSNTGAESSEEEFKKQDSPNPTPKKRTHLQTSRPKVSPKPKPRRATAPMENELTNSSIVKQILTNSEQKGEVRINQPAQQNSLDESLTQRYINIEIRTNSTMLNSKKPPVSPANKRPVVAPKPKK